MDGVSAVASIGQLAGGALKLIETLNTIRQGGKQRLQLLTATSSFWTVLQSAQLTLTDDDGEPIEPCPTALQPLFGTDGVYAQAGKVLTELEVRLKRKDGLRKVMQDLQWPFTKPEVETAMSQLKQLTDAINLALTSSTFSTLLQTQKDTKAVKASTDDQALKQLLVLLSPFDFFQQQYNLSSQVYEGTCQWFTERREFQSWMTGSGAALWCPGIPGAGKTHLASFVVNHLRNLQGCMVLVIYCGYMNPQDQTKEQFLGALVRQMAQLRPRFCEELAGRKRSHSAKGKDWTANLLETFKRQLSASETCYIVIDALDDVLDETKRYELLNTIICENTNVLITSRPLESIKELFHFARSCEDCHEDKLIFHRCKNCDEHRGALCMQCYEQLPNCASRGHCRNKLFAADRLEIEASRSDVQSYVQARINASDKLSKCVKASPALRQYIVDVIVDRAQGMFLLAKLHMDALTLKRTPAAVRKALLSLPSGIDETYDQAIRRIRPTEDDCDEEDSKYAMNVLMWMTFAQRPLSVSEMEHAVTVSFNTCDATNSDVFLSNIDEIDSEEVLSASELTSMCAGLVIIDASDRLLFVHFTTQAYFLSHCKELFPYAHLSLAHSCLSYLSLSALPTADQNINWELVRRYPLLYYSSDHIGWHALGKGNTNTLITRMRRFLALRTNTVFVSKMIYYCNVFNQYTTSQELQFPYSLSHPLHIVAIWGGPIELLKILAQEGGIDVRCSWESTPLMYAVKVGHKHVVDTLLAAGADVNAADQKGDTALHHALHWRRSGIAATLVEQTSLDLHKSNEADQTPWTLAVNWKCRPVLDLMLQNPSFDVNFQTAGGNTALHMAIKEYQPDMIEFLIAHQARTNIRNRQGLTAVTLAEQLGQRRLSTLFEEGKAFLRDVESSASNEPDGLM